MGLQGPEVKILESIPHLPTLRAGATDPKSPNSKITKNPGTRNQDLRLSRHDGGTKASITPK